MVCGTRSIPRSIRSSSLKDRDFPRVGTLSAGPLDAITDVRGVRVGHCTLGEGSIQTGVTVIVPNEDPCLHRPLAAGAVFNGFGKSIGLMQVAELGCIETPIALTNTLAVGTVATAQIRKSIALHPEIGREWPTVNSLVLECNDGYLNDIQHIAITGEHYEKALQAAGRQFQQGSVGAGRGMSCFQMKGGIGSALRIANCDGRPYTVGALVLSNFGKAEHCLLQGRPVGRLLRERIDRAQQDFDSSVSTPEKGSIIMILATDAPLDIAQLGRLARRAGNGLARTGSIYGHGSGDVAVCFSAVQHLPWPESTEAVSILHAPDRWMDSLFQAAAEATEQAIFKALFLAEPVCGCDGHVRRTIRELLPEWRDIVRENW